MIVNSGTYLKTAVRLSILQFPVKNIFFIRTPLSLSVSLYFSFEVPINTTRQQEKGNKVLQRRRALFLAGMAVHVFQKNFK